MKLLIRIRVLCLRNRPVPIPYDDHDANTLYIFEHYTDRQVFQANAQAPWYAEYMNHVAPLLEGQPEVGVSTPVWSKVSAKNV